MRVAFEVYNDRGYGLAEEIYQECLEIELEMRGISFRPKAESKCFYKGRPLKKQFKWRKQTYEKLVHTSWSYSARGGRFGLPHLAKLAPGAPGVRRRCRQTGAARRR